MRIDSRITLKHIKCTMRCTKIIELKAETCRISLAKSTFKKYSLSKTSNMRRMSVTIRPYKLSQASLTRSLPQFPITQESITVKRKRSSQSSQSERQHGRDTKDRLQPRSSSRTFL